MQGEQYAWRITYPGPDGLFDTPDDRETLNQIHVPIHVYLRSKDVIHSFFVPALRLKQDALPGREIPLWFEADVSGVRDRLRRTVRPQPLHDARLPKRAHGGRVPGLGQRNLGGQLGDHGTRNTS